MSKIKIYATLAVIALLSGCGAAEVAEAAKWTEQGIIDLVQQSEGMAESMEDRAQALSAIATELEQEEHDLADDVKGAAEGEAADAAAVRGFHDNALIVQESATRTRKGAEGLAAQEELLNTATGGMSKVLFGGGTGVLSLLTLWLLARKRRGIAPGKEGAKEGAKELIVKEIVRQDEDDLPPVNPDKMLTTPPIP